jgi:AcrR family transcriptional regulator
MARATQKLAKDADTTDRVLRSAAVLFARHGYDGASVRDICADAGASANAIHYHFGNKDALYRQVLERFSAVQSEAGARILTAPPRDLADLETRLTLFVEETLAGLMAEPEALQILYAEFENGFPRCPESVMQAFMGQLTNLTAFFDAAQQNRILGQGVDINIAAGQLFERMGTQARFAGTIGSQCGASIHDDTYRRHWVEQTVSLLLYGTAPRQPRQRSFT